MARILVVDDDLTILKFLQTILAWQSHDVRVTTQPHEALEILQEAPYDLIVLDYLMPDFTGFDFIQTARLMEEVHLPPVIMMTGERTPEIVAKAKQLGVIDYIVKPFDPKIFLSKLTAHLATQTPQPQG